MNDDRYQTMSDESLRQNMMSLKREKNGILSEIETQNGKLRSINVQIEAILKEIGERNYAEMIQHFELTDDHIKLLQKYGGNVDDVTDSDVEIAEMLGWEVSENGLSERQEANVARLLAELKYAQDFVNQRASELVKPNNDKEIN